MPHFKYGLQRSGYITWTLLTLPSKDSSRDELTMQYQLGALATCTAIFVYVFLRRYRKPSAIRDVPGPANPSWIFGMSPAFHLFLQVYSTEY